MHPKKAVESIAAALAPSGRVVFTVRTHHTQPLSRCFKTMIFAHRKNVLLPMVSVDAIWQNGWIPIFFALQISNILRTRLFF